jgi:hypothetical protein
MRRKISLWGVLFLTWIFVVLIVLFGWSVWHIDNGGNRLGKLSKIIIPIASFPSLARGIFVNGIFETLFQNPLLLDDKYSNIQSIRIKHKITEDGYILLSSYDKKYGQSTVKLLRFADSKILHTWVLNIDQIKDRQISLDGFGKKHFRMIHPLLLDNGSIVFQNMSGSLINLDIHSNIKWVLKGIFHHSIELDGDGNIWVPTRIDPSFVKLPVIKLFNDDALGEVSTEGKLLYRKSIADILLENGYRGLLVGVGPVSSDQIHLNCIQPALTTTKYWQKGDLLISLRHRSTVFLYRPATNKILWLKTGPWLNQHDADFIDSTKISIFGNNVIRSNVPSQSDFLISGHNEVYVYDFATDKVSTPYTEFMTKSKIGTLSEGRAQVLDNGDVFVEETNFGRLFRGDKTHAIWSLVDRVDDKTISTLGWCRYISKKEFDEKYSKINFN